MSPLCHLPLTCVGTATMIVADSSVVCNWPGHHNSATIKEAETHRLRANLECSLYKDITKQVCKSTPGSEICPHCEMLFWLFAVTLLFTSLLLFTLRYFPYLFSHCHPSTFHFNRTRTTLTSICPWQQTRGSGLWTTLLLSRERHTSTCQGI